ncbi:hypothetical protein DPMN_148370 [Dreissena polymorpha]|uniref:Uncharacterized protein n=1 Tax=Dreissena polymorpha TaxID=45954 RepID=A0A9D4FAR0_DREPO|nr:hypothetical protein DPMN_148370 [Dreissena polymorpha]
MGDCTDQVASRAPFRSYTCIETRPRFIKYIDYEQAFYSEGWKSFWRLPRQ